MGYIEGITYPGSSMTIVPNCCPLESTVKLYYKSSHGRERKNEEQPTVCSITCYVGMTLLNYHPTSDCGD
jgi:hypothetical protein